MTESIAAAVPRTRGWYVVHIQSGYEDRVHKTLLQKIEIEKLQDRIYNVLIPTEDVVEVKKNKKKISKRKFFPGYVLMDMVVDEITYWMVRGIPGVTGFLGDTNPVALAQEEIDKILELTNTAAEGKPRPAVEFEKGENIRIVDGPFRHFIGVVEEVSEAKAKIKAMVTIFGRPTPVELDFLQVEKILNVSPVMEPEIIPPGQDAGFEGVRVRVAHVKSLGIIGALLALLTMAAAVGFGLLMLFGKALVAALIVKLLWPVIFGPEFTQMVFGSQSVPFWKVFLLLAAGSVVAKMLWPASWGRR